MTGITEGQSHLFSRIKALLEMREHETAPESEGRTRAAVALILHQAGDDLEILFIQRAAHDLDPWSGHIAFPGGKLEEDELVCQTARRETWEETGIDLEQGRFLGRLSDIVGANLPVRVSCCVFEMDRSLCLPVLNDEVRDLFWTALSDLRDKKRHVMTAVAFGDRSFDVPAIQLPFNDKPVLWGITYRLVMQFLELFDHGVANFKESCTLPGTIELIEEE